MADRILKYLIPLIGTGPASLMVPIGSSVLSVGFQRDLLYLWLRGDLREGSLRPINLFVVETGKEVPDEAAWLIGRAMTDDGTHVVHVFSAERPHV